MLNIETLKTIYLRTAKKNVFLMLGNVPNQIG